MPFIIEGPDAVGKTTVAHRIVEMANSLGKFPAYYSHMSKPPPTWDYYNDYLMRSQPFAVQDRFHLGGCVYGDICRGGSKISTHALRLLTAHLTLQGSFTLLITADPEWLEATLQSHAKKGRLEMYDRGTIIKVNEGYKELSERYPEARVDAWWEVGNPNFDSMYPDDRTILGWLNAWFERLDQLMELESHRLRGLFWQ